MTNKVCMVLGPGRSGTSLIMHLLRILGVRMSTNLIPPKYHNPYGPMEDAELAELFDRTILPELNCNRLLPPPLDRRLSEQHLKSLRRVITSILQDDTNCGSSAYVGLKDPIFSNFLPYFFPIFNQLKIIPKFILCVRNPLAVAHSRKTNFDTSSALTELAWLTNTVNSIVHTGGDCFIIHYEELIGEEGNSILETLSNYLKLPDDKLTDAISFIESNLDRSGQVVNTSVIKNKAVVRLYDELKSCRGNIFDKAKLLSVAMDCQHEMEGYRGWLESAYEAIKLNVEKKGLSKEIVHFKNKVKDVTQSTRKTSLLKSELAQLTSAFSRLQKNYN